MNQDLSNIGLDGGLTGRHGVDLLSFNVKVSAVFILLFGFVDLL